ncbi:RidA family protein [Desulforhopalus vacuolatus]|uniref:RidA family protein n=1 Tax=Desulforhopalus vacuolatus TaxID=40414 RepID=UPI001966A393|nr:RidA family protein [Desulforhopalus vacuolatus]MBM9519108.1 RidA family protein [Desulforhopalus vacuolatus]
MEYINTDKAPAAIGPYAPAVRVGNLCFISGQVPFHPQTGEVVGKEIREQTRQALTNLGSILEAGKLKITDLAQTTIYLSNMDDFSDFNEVYAEFMGAHRPARSCVEVSRLPHDVLVEITAIAVEEK